MRDMYEIEDIVLGMAEMVHENRALRRENSELRLQVAKYEALFDSMYGGNKVEAKRRYDILSDIEQQNNTFCLHRSAGWVSNERYIDNWEAELERRMNEGEGLEEVLTGAYERAAEGLGKSGKDVELEKD